MSGVRVERFVFWERHETPSPSRRTTIQSRSQRILVDLATGEAYEDGYCHLETESVRHSLGLGPYGYGDQLWLPITKRATVSDTSQMF